MDRVAQINGDINRLEDDIKKLREERDAILIAAHPRKPGTRLVEHRASNRKAELTLLCVEWDDRVAEYGRLILKDGSLGKTEYKLWGEWSIIEEPQKDAAK